MASKKQQIMSDFETYVWPAQQDKDMRECHPNPLSKEGAFNLMLATLLSNGRITDHERRNWKNPYKEKK